MATAAPAAAAHRPRTQIQRNLDRGHRKSVAPRVNRALNDSEPPPVMVAVVGPKGCGKSTLIRCLVKLHTGQTIGDPTGPITVVAGKAKRITFLECPNDLGSMTDVAKVVDLVLLMVDASFGFEMETFEFLNLLQAHGFPKVMVCTVGYSTTSYPSSLPIDSHLLLPLPRASSPTWTT